MSYGPKPGGAFSDSGVCRTFLKHQKTPHHTMRLERIIVIQPAVFMVFFSQSIWMKSVVGAAPARTVPVP